jgi:hypothetical protein
VPFLIRISLILCSISSFLAFVALMILEQSVTLTRFGVYPRTCDVDQKMIYIVS